MKKINKIIKELYNDKKQLLVLSSLVYISCLIDKVLCVNTDVIHATGGLIAIAAVTAVGIGVTAYQGKQNRDAAEDLSEDQLKQQRAQQALLQKQMQEYKDFKFENPYADITNPYAQVSNPYANMENVYQDLTVNQQQAEFEKQMSQQQQANIMQGLRGAAGSSGIAGLAQAMANQGQLQAQRASASIGMQESNIQKLQASEASRLNELERRGEQQALMTRLGGEEKVDLLRRQGEAAVQQQEFGRVSTLLGMQQQMTAGAQSGYQQALFNEQAVNMANQQAMAQIAAAGVGAMGAMGGTGGSGKKRDPNAGPEMMSYTPDFDSSKAGQDVSFGGNTYSVSGGN
jgi:hypothetical protein